MILNWGATAQERDATLPCDAITPDAALSADRAISIDAPRSTVFGWLCQLRIAPYSYDLLDNFGRRSPRTRNPELAQLHRGQRFMHVFTLHSFVDDKHITLQSGKVAVTYAVRDELDATRLHVRVRFDGPRVIGWVMAAGDVVMMRKQLITLRDLAEQEAAPATS